MTLYQYSGSGSLNESSEVNKNRSFSYNRSSVYLYVTEDFGGIGILPQPNGFSNNSIDFSQTTHTFDEIVVYEEVDVDDYGNLTTSANETDDYGPIAGFGSTETLYPFGGLTLSGSAITQSNYRLYISGSAIVNFRSNYQTSGTLFEFGQKLENRSYAYNLSSTFDSADDYGSVTGISGLIDDYGSISESGALFEYGLIKEPIPVGILSPFGKLTLSGSAITQSNYRLYFSGSAIEKFVHYPNNLTGTLFGFGQKLESITFDYNESSISTNILDYGLLTNFVNELGDYGNILESSGSSAADSYGLITEPNPTEPITYPFGSLSISGSASKQLRTSEVGRGTIRVRGEVVVKPTQRQVGSGFIAVSGTSRSIVGLNYPTSGSLFSFGEKLESVTYDYNQDSIVSNPLVDFGSVSGVSTESYDYGLITSDIDGGIDNYGIISNPFDSTPFGTITLSGSSLESFNESPYTTSGSIFVFSGSAYAESFTANPSENAQLFNIFGSSEGKLIYNYAGFELISISGTALEKDVDSYVGVGTAFISGTALESYSPNPPENTELFNISGVSTEVFVANPPENTELFIVSGTALGKEVDSYVASGSLFSFGEKLESVTYDYNESSIKLYESLDYGLVSNIDDNSEDCGLIANVFDAIDDYEFIVGYGATETIYPFGSISISGVSTEVFVANPPENTELFQIYGTALEKDVDSYLGIGTGFISGTALEKDVDSYVGIGTAFIFGTALESYSPNPPENTELFNISGVSTEVFVANPPENTQLFQIYGTALGKEVDSYLGIGTINIYGELVHPNIDYTPHYGIDKNIGIGTTGIQLYGFALESYSPNPPENTQLFQISGIATERVTFNPPENTQLFQISGTALEKDVDSYVGVGTAFISGTALEKDVDSYVGVGTAFISGTALEKDVDSYVGVGTAFISGTALESYSPNPPENTTLFRIDISSRNYSPIYPGNVNIPGSGIGTIRINDDRRLTVTRAVLPIFGKGTIFISSSGNESFSITNYNGKGLLRISGIASTREIATYESVGFGTIILSQTGREKDVNSYVGLSSITISGTRDDRTTKNYSGFGNLTTLSGLSESYSAKTPNNIQLFSLSGSGQESYLAQTPETEVLYQFNGNLVESRTYGYEGSGQTTFGSAATTIFKPSVFGVGLFKFTTHLSDNLYDTCDSLDITCDYQDSALVKFVANPPETTILFNLSGSALTKEIQVYTSFGSGIVGISGSSVLKKTKSFVGIGTLNTGSLSDKKNVHSYFGSGSINIFFGSAESTTSIPPTSTELYVFSGSASTKITKLKRYSGIGTEYFSGIANTKKLSKPSYFGIGTIVLSGQLVYPNIKFIPAPKGIGSITILGSGTKKLIKNPSSSGSLFLISNGTQSFSRKPYSGIGTIYISDTSGITRNNPYQIPRVYVTII